MAPYPHTLQLNQLESVVKGLVDELAASGGQTTPRLRELLATGAGLVAAVQAATGHLGSTLPEGPALPPRPSRSDVGALQAASDDTAVAPPSHPNQPHAWNACCLACPPFTHLASLYSYPFADAVWEQQLEKQQQPVVLPTPVSQPAGTLADLAASLSRLPSTTLELLEGKQPAAQAATATAVLLRCGRAFAAVVQLQQAGSLLPLRVGVLSAAEASAALAGSSSSSLWAPSQHAVFQQLSGLAGAAIRHYLQQQQQQGMAQGSALELLLLWLATHSDLFTRRSSSSGTLLLADPAGPGGGLLPPLRRPVQLSWQELWQAALNPHLRQAEHLAEA